MGPRQTQQRTGGFGGAKAGGSQPHCKKIPPGRWLRLWSRTPSPVKPGRGHRHKAEKAGCCPVLYHSTTIPTTRRCGWARRTLATQPPRPQPPAAILHPHEAPSPPVRPRHVPRQPVCRRHLAAANRIRVRLETSSAPGGSRSRCQH